MILRTGLTGGLASGKSTIARMFAALGCLTLDADDIVKRLYRPGAAGHDALVRTYGREIMLPDFTIDRRKLADIAFASSDAARQLNALIHPLVIEEQQRCIADEERRFPTRDRIVIVEATLLIESGGRERFDRVIVVDVDPAVQVRRAIARGMSHSDAERRIANQMPREERLRYADYVIDNSGTTRDAQRETMRVYESLRADVAAKKKGAGVAAGASDRDRSTKS